MGLITVGVGTLMLVPESYVGVALTGVLLYALHHGLAKGALFLGVGFVGTSRRAVAALLLPALALSGLPLTSGAIAKAGLKSGVEHLPNGWAATVEMILPFAAVGTTLLMVRFLQLMWQRATNEKPAKPMLWPVWAALLVAVAVVMPLWPDASYATSKSLEAEKLWVSTWPIALGLLLAVGFALLTRPVPALARFTLPAGDVLPLMQRAPRWLAATLLKVTDPVKKQLDEAVLEVQAMFTERANERSRRVNGWELRLRDWTVAGSLLLVLSLGFLAAVWLGSS
jgi:hydrogenase-4 component B